MATPPNTQFHHTNPANSAVSSSGRSMETTTARACTNCVRAKARCSAGVDAEGKCERCHRMKKVCQPSPPVRRQRILKKTTPHETSKLEEKLDGLVTLLKSATQGVPGTFSPAFINSSPVGPEPQSHGTSISTATTFTQEQYEYSKSSTTPSGSNFTPATSSPSDRASLGNLNSQPTLRPGLEPSPGEAEVILNRFRNDFVPNLPFIIIPPYTSAYQLRQERPLLWISIMAVASNNSIQQISLSKEVRGIFAREAFVEGTRNMDLLLAIIVYASWDRRIYFGRPLLISLVQLAIAVMLDLGLDKPPSKDPALMLAHELKGTTRPSRTPTNEERRALLGCFMLSTVSCFTLRKCNTLCWTVYANECLDKLERENEFDSDALLVQLVKLRLLSEKVNEIPWSTSVPQVDSAARAPVSFYLKSLETQLQDLKANIPSHLFDNKILVTELYSTQRIIYEVGLSHAPDIFRGQENRHIECLWACTNASKSWVDAFLSIPIAQYVGFSALIYSNMTHWFLTVYRLSTLDHADWDRALCLEHLHVGSFLEQGVKNFARVKEVVGLENNGDVVDSFSIMASRIQIIKMSWDAVHSSQFPSVVEPSADENHELFDFPMEFSEGDWLKDLLGPWHD